MNSPAPIGFLIWCPDHGLPTTSHSTYARAVAEHERLSRVHPGRLFYIMSPLRTPGAKTKAEAYSEGMAEGLAQSRREVMVAERRTDELYELRDQLRRDLDLLRPFRDKAADFQAIVADCLTWIEGFRSAFALKEQYERPTTPDPDSLRKLNGALQAVMRARGRPAAGALDLDDDEIPF